MERLSPRDTQISITSSVEGWKDTQISECGERLVDLSEFYNAFILKPQYFLQGISGSTEQTFLREGVAERLLDAARNLPDGYRFVVWDGWRPLSVQQSLFDDFFSRLRRENSVLLKEKTLSKEELERLTQIYVSLPSSDPLKPSPHNTGGAVDLTIADENGNELTMGTEFDDFSPAARTDYFEFKNNLTNQEKQFRDNRRLLFHSLAAVGFTNYPEEWWHFDYGNQFWAVQKRTNAVYGQITPRVQEKVELLVVRPLGPQGPKIGIELTSRDDYVRFDEAMGTLPERARKTREGVLTAVKKAGLRIIDY